MGVARHRVPTLGSPTATAPAGDTVVATNKGSTSNRSRPSPRTKRAPEPADLLDVSRHVGGGPGTTVDAWLAVGAQRSAMEQQPRSRARSDHALALVLYVNDAIARDALGPEVRLATLLAIHGLHRIAPDLPDTHAPWMRPGPPRHKIRRVAV